MLATLGFGYHFGLRSCFFRLAVLFLRHAFSPAPCTLNYWVQVSHHYSHRGELRNRQCKKSVEEIGRALTGTWRAEHLFVLKQALELYDFYTKQVESCDIEIERMYALTRPDWEAGEVKPLTAKKRKSKSKNAPEQKEEIRKHLKRISGVDLSVVDGFGVSLAQTAIMEVGTVVGKVACE